MNSSFPPDICAGKHVLQDIPRYKLAKPNGIDEGLNHDMQATFAKMLTNAAFRDHLSIGRPTSLLVLAMLGLILSGM